MGRKKKVTSKAYTVTLTTLAKQHKDEMEDFISLIRNQTSNALKVGDAFDQILDRIERNPYAYKACEEIPTQDKSVRKATCLSWNIIYKIIEFDVYVLGIIHQSQRPSEIERLGK